MARTELTVHNHGRRIKELEEKTARLEAGLVTLIVWMAQSANSPINLKEAETLIAKIEQPADPTQPIGGQDG